MLIKELDKELRLVKNYFGQIQMFRLKNIYCKYKGEKLRTRKNAEINKTSNLR